MVSHTPEFMFAQNSFFAGGNMKKFICSFGEQSCYFYRSVQ